MATLIENYICQHFGNIYQQICNGTKGQYGRSMQLESKNSKCYEWRLNAEKSRVLECIHQFLFLCLNAGEINKDYEEIEEWTRILMIVSCMPTDSGITDSYKYSKLIEASDQITKYIFSCFNWHLYDIDQEENATFFSRINYYKKTLPNEYMSSAELLSDLRKLRNNKAHLAKSDFYINHQICINRLIYTLYDYITVFYMITNVCIDFDRGSRIRLHNNIIKKTQMPINFLTLHIVVDCVDEKTGNIILERQKDIRLYRQGKKGERALVNHLANHPGHFEVNYYDQYVICLVTDGVKSDYSERFVIEHNFLDGTIVKINIPPYGAPKPEKINIRELIFNADDLPADAKWILDSIENYTENCEFAEVARQLIMASVTKSQFSKKAYQEALKQLKESLKQKTKDELPKNLNEFIKTEMLKFQEHISDSFKPYKGKDDFFELFECIDDLYDMFESSGYDDNTSLISQIRNNADELFDKKKLSVATTASDKTNLQTRRLAKLKYFLSMQEKYPEIIELESVNLWKLAEQLYLNQTNYYFDYSTPVRESVIALLDEVRKEAHQPFFKKALVYAILLDKFLNDAPDNVIRIVQLCSDTLLHWIENCRLESDIKSIELSQECCVRIKSLRDNRNLLMPMIRVSDDEKKELEQTYETIINCINKIKDPKDMMDVARDSSWIIAEFRYDILMKLVHSCSPETMMQLVCCSYNVKIQLEWLFNDGPCISYSGFPEGSDFRKWQDANSESFKICLCEINKLWHKFSGRDRHRYGENYFSEEIEVSNEESLLIVNYITHEIEKNYGKDYPEFLKDIIEAPCYVIPNHAKAMLLRKVSVPLSCETESLVFVISEVLNYWGYSEHIARVLLENYIFGKYSKELVSKKALDEFFLMPRSSQRLYLDILINNTQLTNHFACLLPSVRFMLAYRLIFTKGYNRSKVIDPHDFYRKMSAISSKDIQINYSDYNEFDDLTNLVSLVAQYSNKHPEDEILSTQSRLLTRHYDEACIEHFDRHLDFCPIPEGEWGKLGILHKITLRKVLKGKDQIEQTIIRYLDLYNGLEYDFKDPGRYNLGWCKVEKELFKTIISFMHEMTSESQHKMCNELWYHIHLRKYRMPYDDIKAERLLLLRPFWDQDSFDKTVDSFLSIQAHNKLTIGNPSILEGLKVIQNLLVQCKKSTAFVDILIEIYKKKSMQSSNNYAV